MSRLARNNSDWYQLLDLAATFWTLIADAQGVYDPRSYNDRMLLGLKGTMSEAEAYSLKMRLKSGCMNQVKRGEYRQRLPAGLERLPDGTVVKDPDAQVRETLELVFTKFEELRSCAKVMGYLAHHEIKLPRRLPRGGVIFRHPTDEAVTDIINNPAYAGAFVYGRRQTDLFKGVREHRMPMTKWIHLQHGVYPAYISWRKYLDNNAQINQNYGNFLAPRMKSKGSPRSGRALIQGLALCGNCGEHMRVNYVPKPRYYCAHKRRRAGGERCPSMPATPVDEAVLRAFFKAIAPSQLDALERVLVKRRDERGRLDRHWQRVLRRAEFNATRDQERFEAVDARNRLVAQTLEARWEESLAEVLRLRGEYEVFSNSADCDHIPRELRAQLKNISSSLPQLWEGGSIPAVRMKELIRCLIDKVVLKSISAGEIEVRIVWVSGGGWGLSVKKSVFKCSDSPDYEKAVSRIKYLWELGLSDHEIARKLDSEGLRSPRTATFPPSAVQSIRLRRGWTRPPRGRTLKATPAGYIKPAELAHRMGVAPITVYRYIKKGVIPSKYLRFGDGCLIKDCDGMRRRVKVLKGY